MAMKFKIRRVKYQLDGHENNDDVAARQHTRHANYEKQGAEWSETWTGQGAAPCPRRQQIAPKLLPEISAKRGGEKVDHKDCISGSTLVVSAGLLQLRIVCNFFLQGVRIDIVRPQPPA